MSSILIDPIDPNEETLKQFNGCGHKASTGIETLRDIINGIGTGEARSVATNLHNSGHFRLDQQSLPAIRDFHERLIEVAGGIRRGELTETQHGGLNVLAFRNTSLEGMQIDFEANRDVDRLLRFWDIAKQSPSHDYKGIVIANLLTILKQIDRTTNEKHAGNFINVVIKSEQAVLLAEQSSNFRRWLIEAHPQYFDFKCAQIYCQMLKFGNQQEVDLALASIDFYDLKIRRSMEPAFSKTDDKQLGPVNSLLKTGVEALAKNWNPNCQHTELHNLASQRHLIGEQESLSVRAARLLQSLVQTVTK